MLTWTSIIEDTPTPQDIADMQQHHHDLQIRSLLEFPALRVAMGLDRPTEAVTNPAVAERTVTTAKRARRRNAKRTPQAASAPRTGAAKQHPRFDRRALLETDRVG